MKPSFSPAPSQPPSAIEELRNTVRSRTRELRWRRHGLTSHLSTPCRPPPERIPGGGTQKRFKKALGAIKDSTTVNLAKVNSNFTELDIAIVRATNHVERAAKEKHMEAIFAAISATRPRADVAYCIHALARRLSKTCNWASDDVGMHLVFWGSLLIFSKKASSLLSIFRFQNCDEFHFWVALEKFKALGPIPSEAFMGPSEAFGGSNNGNAASVLVPTVSGPVYSH